MSSVLKSRSLKGAALGLLAGFVTLSMIGLSTTPAEAVIYCRTVGVPKGCVVRPGVRVVTPRVVTPVVRVRPGVGVNANGGVNRIGVR